MEEYRSFPVRLPSGVQYWTVVDGAWRVHEAADGFLLHMRLGRDLAESSTRAYAISLALFLDRCAGTGLEWQRAPQALGRFVHWLRYHDASRAGPPDLSRPVRGERRVNCVLEVRLVRGQRQWPGRARPGPGPRADPISPAMLPCSTSIEHSFSACTPPNALHTPSVRSSALTRGSSHWACWAA